MTNDVQTKANSQMTVEQVSEKYNGGKKIIDFVGKRKIFFGISIAIIVLGIICNFIIRVSSTHKPTRITVPLYI